MSAAWSRTHRVLLGTAIGAVALWFVTVAVLYFAIPRWQGWIRDQAIATLREEFGRDVRIASLQATVAGTKVRVIARGIQIGDIIQADRADAQTGLLPWHVHSVVVDHLSVRLRPDEKALINPPRGAGTTIGEFVANNATLDILQLHFQLANIRVTDFDPRRAAAFTASVLLAEPKAVIDTQGRFGPWNIADPSQTPMHAAYTMRNCDLATVPGLAGTLSSQGHIQGVLSRTAINGDAQIAGFGLSVSGRTQPAHVHFEGAMDASDGSASISALNGALANSSFTAQGTVHDIEDDQRRQVAFDVTVPKGRLEDVLPLGVRSKVSPLSGALQARAKVTIVAGDRDILGRIRLTADFNATNARFASLDLRERLRDMSRKAQGHPKDQAAGSSITDMQGQVEMSNGVARFSKLDLELEGVSAQLQGTYQLASERMDLTGMVTMEAKLSQTSTGAKALLLKIADPLFRSKQGGARVAIRVTGTREDPQFGLSLGK